MANHRRERYALRRPARLQRPNYRRIPDPPNLSPPSDSDFESRRTPPPPRRRPQDYTMASDKFLYPPSSIGNERSPVPVRSRLYPRRRSPSPSKIVVDEFAFDPVGSETNTTGGNIPLSHRTYVNPTNHTYELDPSEPYPEAVPPDGPPNNRNAWTNKTLAWKCGHMKFQAYNPDGIALCFLQDRPIGEWSLGIESIDELCDECLEAKFKAKREADDLLRKNRHRKRRQAARKQGIQSCLDQCFYGIQTAFLRWFLGGGPAAAKLIKEEEEREGFVAPGGEGSDSESSDFEPRDGYEAMERTMKKWDHELRDIGRGRAGLRQRRPEA